MAAPFPAPKPGALYYPDDAFSRLDEADDAEFYSQERMVPHLDRRALATVERIIGTLIVEESPSILDLLASWDSHIPQTVQPSRLVGVGMNAVELEANSRLDDFVIHDLNHEPHLPFASDTFDVVVNTVSVDYLTRPFEIFAEIGRILVPGGVHLVVFSSRMFKEKAVKIWRQSDDTGRQILVEDYFRSAPAFGPVSTFVSMGQPRPRDDKYAGLGIPSDPVWAVWAEKTGGELGRTPRPAVSPEPSPIPSPEVVAKRKAEMKTTLCCPYCVEKLVRWDIEPTPFTEWPNEFFWVCFNNDCPYLIQGWGVMASQGAPGISYRLVYDPDNDRCMPIAIPNVKAQRDYTITPRG